MKCKQRSLTVFFTSLLVAGCTSMRADSWPRHDYFEMVDKSEFAEATEDDIFMHWNRVDTFCGAQAKQYALDRAYRVILSQIRGTYINCMATNNFRLLDPQGYQDVAELNKAKYGASFVIEKTWPAVD